MNIDEILKKKYYTGFEFSYIYETIFLYINFRFSTDVIFNGGMNPFPSVENNKYPIFIASVGKWDSLVLLSLLTLVLRFF